MVSFRHLCLVCIFWFPLAATVMADEKAGGMTADISWIAQQKESGKQADATTASEAGGHDEGSHRYLRGRDPNDAAGKGKPDKDPRAPNGLGTQPKPKPSSNPKPPKA